MSSEGAVHVEKCLGRLRDKYNLDAISLKRIMNLKKYIITSIAFTTDGGFDESTGFFHSEERALNYKIRIKFKKSDDMPEEFLVLKPIEKIKPNGGTKKHYRLKKKETSPKKTVKQNGTFN